jgi:hypothetical protein
MPEQEWTIRAGGCVLPVAGISAKASPPRFPGAKLGTLLLVVYPLPPCLHLPRPTHPQVIHSLIQRENVGWIQANYFHCSQSRLLLTSWPPVALPRTQSQSRLSPIPGGSLTGSASTPTLSALWLCKFRSPRPLA